MRLIILLTFIIISGILKAQEDTQKQAAAELGFLTHLVNTQQYEEAIYHFNHLALSQYASVQILDSLYFLKGWAFYSLRQLDSSAIFFQKLTPHSALYQNALFFASSDYIFLNESNKAREVLKRIPANDSIAKQVQNLQYAGLSLLNHDYGAYKNYSSYFGHAHYALSNEEVVLDDCYKSMTSFNSKSLFLAGTLSAIIPGLGKLYAGKEGEAVSSFLLIGFLGAITTENYIKAGPTNYKTIIFGSLFTVFYIGNIYGSVASLKLVREEFYKKYENTIQLHIHIPLRTIYGR